MKKNKLQQFLIILNELLHNNGFIERFVFERKTFEEEEVDTLVIYHTTDEDKAIFIIDDDYECTLYYLNYHSHIEYQNTIYESVANIFEAIKEILDNKRIVFNETDEKGNILMAGSVPIYIDINNVEYSKKEKEILAKKTLIIDLWSEVVSEKHMLFLVGSIYTNKFQ